MLTFFSSFLCPLLIFLIFFLVCLICAVILNTINLDFMAIFFPTKNHLRGNLKLMFCHFSQRQWIFEIFFGKSVLSHLGKIHFQTSFIFSDRPIVDVLVAGCRSLCLKDWSCLIWDRYCCFGTDPAVLAPVQPKQVHSVN